MRVWETPAGSATPATGPPGCGTAVGRSTSRRGMVGEIPAPRAAGPGPGPLHRYLSLAPACLCCTGPACPPPSPCCGPWSPLPPSRRAATGQDGGRGGGGKQRRSPWQRRRITSGTSRQHPEVPPGSAGQGRRAGNMSDNEDKCERDGRGEGGMAAECRASGRWRGSSGGGPGYKCDACVSPPALTGMTSTMWRRMRAWRTWRTRRRWVPRGPLR